MKLTVQSLRPASQTDQSHCTRLSGYTLMLTDTVSRWQYVLPSLSGCRANSVAWSENVVTSVNKHSPEGMLLQHDFSDFYFAAFEKGAKWYWSSIAFRSSETFASAPIDATPTLPAINQVRTKLNPQGCATPH